MNPEIPRSRLLFFFFALATGFLLVVAQQARLALGFGRSLQDDSPKRPERGAIYDRKGVPLAISLERYHIYLNTRKAIPPKIREPLKTLLALDENALRGFETNVKTHLVLKHASGEIAEGVRRLKCDALLVEKVYQRAYPQGALMAHTLGFTGFEGTGFAGLERQYQDVLSGGGGRSNQGDLLLSLDADLQYAAERVLQEGVADHEADGGCLLVEEVGSGRMLAMAVAPGFDPGRLDEAHGVRERNPAVSDPIEPGSIFKIFFLTHLLERYQVDLDKPYYYCNERTVLENGEVIADYKSWGWVGFRDIVKHSINGGIIQAAQPLSQQDRYDLIVRIKMNQPTGIDLPAEHKGILRPTRDWGIRTTATVLIGQGLAVTPVQLLSSFSALVGGGVWVPPRVVDHLVWRGEQGVYTQHMAPTRGTRIFEAEASRRAVGLLTAGTLPGSTGEQARNTGYASAGKTGTSQMVNLERGGYYSNRFNALFIGAFPDQNPKVAVLVIIFNPRQGHTGGVAAAPLYARLMPDMVRHLDLPVTRELSTLPARVLEASRVAQVSPGPGVPDLIGLSERDARVRFDAWTAKTQTARGAVLVVSGEGYVRSQSPPAGTVPSSPSPQILIQMAPP